LRVFGPQTFAVVARTWKYEILGQENLDQALQAHGGCLITLWHGRMLLGLPLHPTSRIAALVSPSEDGSLAKQLLDANGYQVIRGSSYDGGAQALRAILTFLEGGGVIVITPDGPRGPRHMVNPGIAWLARESGFPVVPAGLACDRAWHTQSWDHFTIPKPRARLVVRYSSPIRVSKGEGDADGFSERIRNSMLEGELEGFAHLGVEPDF
jgi:lysophospholipid acyltransferase (LPLAT)-like uncharacterized protein